MAISVPNNLQLKLPRFIVYLIVKFITFKLNINGYLIAGSYRRSKFICGDIDLVIPAHLMQDLDSKMKSMGWFLNPMRNHNATLSRQYLKKIKFFNIRKIIVLDIFPYTDENLGNVLVFATGSAAHNGRIRNSLESQGMSWKNPAFILIKSTNEKLTFKSENDFFNFLNLKTKPPRDRYE